MTPRRDAEAVLQLARRIGETYSDAPGWQFMEFCGGHTHAVARYGLRALLPASIRLSTGPGCPVCVTSQGDVDLAVSVAGHDGVTIATFGDLMRVPGTRGSLIEARSQGASVEVVYSPLDALALADERGDRLVVFVGVGFETTAPLVAATVLQAQARRVPNFAVLSLHKLTPPAMRAVLDSGETLVSGVIGPGHVTAIVGPEAWGFLPQEYRVGCAVAGFEPLDILEAVDALAAMRRDEAPVVVNCYARGVPREGNATARRVMDQAFVVSDATWRGLGRVPQSALTLRPELAEFDAMARLGLVPVEAPESMGCRCGEVLRGAAEPEHCGHFGRRCTPEAPLGPCMVASEGACSARYLELER